MHSNGKGRLGEFAATLRENSPQLADCISMKYERALMIDVEKV